MNVISRQRLIAYGAANPLAKGQLDAWYLVANKAKWKTPQDIKNAIRSASIIANDRVVFNIKGNDYRLIVGVDYDREFVYIKFIGTHAEYDQVDAATVEQK
jgi:mRNA interferase HigB